MTTKENKVYLSRDRLFGIMDIEDVMEELLKLKDRFEEVSSNSEDKVTKFKASYSALALAEASNALKYIKTHPEAVKEGED